MRTVSRNIDDNGGFEMGVNSVNDAGSAYGAAFRNKPVYFMTGKAVFIGIDIPIRDGQLLPPLSVPLCLPHLVAIFVIQGKVVITA